VPARAGEHPASDPMTVAGARATEDTANATANAPSNSSRAPSDSSRAPASTQRASGASRATPANGATRKKS
jgi:hypothetical protein